MLGVLGFDAKPLSARVRIQRPRDFVPPRTHMFIRVDLGGDVWLTDVGVGGASLTAAIRFQEGQQPTPHDPRRLVREGELWFHQIRYGDEWHDVYEFTSEQMPLTGRSPIGSRAPISRSHFRDRLMVARALPEGRRLTLLNRDFTVREQDGRADTRAIASAEELLAILADSFGLHFARAHVLAILMRRRPGRREPVHRADNTVLNYAAAGQRPRSLSVGESKETLAQTPGNELTGLAAEKRRLIRTGWRGQPEGEGIDHDLSTALRPGLQHVQLSPR